MTYNQIKEKPRYSLSALNIAALIIGMIIVWMTSHNWLTMLGAFIASLHFSVPAVAQIGSKEIKKRILRIMHQYEKFGTPDYVRAEEFKEWLLLCFELRG